MIDILPDLQALLPAAIAPQLMTLIALIVAQVLLAVAVAVKEKFFDWSSLGDFYASRVVPYLIGWFALTLLTKYATAALLGEYGAVVGDTIVWGAWLAIIGSLANRIYSSIRILYGKDTPPWNDLPMGDDDPGA